MQDLSGPAPLGQVSLALSREKYLKRWGQHYLPSLHGAHARQVCNSFKDPGALRYGTGSSLFTRCRDALSSAFNDLPAPEPSNIFIPGGAGGHTMARYVPNGAGAGARGAFITRGKSMFTPSISMRSYNSSSAPCFAGRTPVRLAKDGNKHIRISSLRRGYAVATPAGPKKVATVLMTPVRRQVMVRIEGVLVTPWHPFALPTAGPVTGRDDGHGWVFPAQVRPSKLMRYTGAIYSVLLERDEDVDAHAIAIGSGPGEAVPFWGVTLGHGIVEARGNNDVRAHSFFGSYDNVLKSLEILRIRWDGLVIGGGLMRSKNTGLVTGFKAYQPRHRAAAGLPFSTCATFAKHRFPISTC